MLEVDYADPCMLAPETPTAAKPSACPTITIYYGCPSLANTYLVLNCLKRILRALTDLSTERIIVATGLLQTSSLYVIAESVW